MQDDRVALSRRQFRERVGEGEKVVDLVEPAFGGGLVGDQEFLGSRKGVFNCGDRGFERLFAVGVALLGCEGADGIGDVMEKDLAEPAGGFAVGCSAELGAFLVSFEQRLLSNVGRVEAAMVARMKMSARQQAEVVAEPIEPEVSRLRVAHGKVPESAQRVGVALDREHWSA